MTKYRVAHSFRSESADTYITNGARQQAAIDAMDEGERERQIERGRLVVLDAPATKPISAMNKEELLAEAAAREIEVEGTGADGAVLVKDLRAALADTEE